MLIQNLIRVVEEQEFILQKYVRIIFKDIFFPPNFDRFDSFYRKAAWNKSTLIFLESWINQFSNIIIQLWRRLRDRLSRLRLLHTSLSAQDTSASVEKVPKKVNREVTFHERSRKVGNKNVQLTGRKTTSNLKIELEKLRRINLFTFLNFAA